MIDGVKIDVPNVANEWLNNHLLDFYTYTNTKTGELLDGTLVATYRGLKFFITQSVKHPNKTFCYMRGSLHKYFNKGKHNANDFTLENLQSVITELQQKFNIDPRKAILRNVEFGVNIYTQKTARVLINNLVSNGNRSFSDFNIDRKKLGKVISKDRYKVKIYDKGKQERKPFDNLVRIEIAVKKMQYLQPFAIFALADLMELDKVKPLGALLIDFWKGSIYYDKQVNYKEMSDFQRKKILYYATPRNWEDFTPIQRTRAKRIFYKLMRQFGTNKDHEKITALIAEKWNELTADKCICMHNDFKENESKEMYMNASLNAQCKHIQTHYRKRNTKKPKNHTQKRGVCIVCKEDISRKKKNALYCSKKCNNSNQALKRKVKRHNLKKSETDQLNKLLVTLQKNNYKLLVEYKTALGEYADTLYQNEIATSYSWIRKVIRLTVFAPNKNTVFTSYRAKQLITNINNLNKMKNEK